MMSKYKADEGRRNLAVTTMTSTASSSSTIMVTSSFSQTTRTVTTAGGLTRTTEQRSSFSGYPGTSYSPTFTPYRSAFNNQPTAAYRSFNIKKSDLNSISAPPPEMKKSKSLLASIFKSSDKEKTDKKPKEKKEKIKVKEKDTKSNNVQSNKLQGGVDAKPFYNSSTSVLTPYRSPLFNINDLEEKLVIKVTKTGKFRGSANDTIPTYMTHSKYNRGKVLLINNIAFGKNKYRHGADVDHKNIKKLFEQMGFSVKDHKNNTKKQMENIIMDHCRNSSLRNMDISVAIIMSHGNGVHNSTFIETIDNDIIESEWIIKQFSDSIVLANKPKIFIFQCCRGDEYDNTEVDASPFQQPRTQSDILLAYATVPGYVSHRDPKLGTWYIQAICKIFMEHAHEFDIENLLKIVDDNLMKTYSKRRQTSSYENRGFKRCFLNPI